MASFTTVIPGDDHHLALTGLVTVALQLVCFFIAYLLQFDKITDFAGSGNFVLLALLTFFVGGSGWAAGGAALNARAAILTALVVVTRVELALYLLYRVLMRGKDERFDAIRLNFVPFLVFWIFQMVWVWGVCLPVIFVNTEVSRAPLGAADGVGIAMWAIGFVVQIVADVEKNTFRSNPANSGKCCDIGLWKWSRHPNYFGEILRACCAQLACLALHCTPQPPLSSFFYAHHPLRSLPFPSSVVGHLRGCQPSVLCCRQARAGVGHHSVPAAHHAHPAVPQRHPQR